MWPMGLLSILFLDQDRDFLRQYHKEMCAGNNTMFRSNFYPPLSGMYPSLWFKHIVSVQFVSKQKNTCSNGTIRARVWNTNMLNF
jgi:hypothetical protein